MKIETKAFLGVASLLGISVIANLTMLYFSIVSNDGLVEENYYNKGLNYQDEIDRQKNQEKLGWNVSFNRTDKTYTVIAKDINSLPLESAKVSINFFRPSQSGFDKNVILKEVNSGIYQTQVKLDLKGIWNTTTEIKKGGNKWKRKEKIVIN